MHKIQFRSAPPSAVLVAAAIAGVAISSVMKRRRRRSITSAGGSSSRFRRCAASARLQTRGTAGDPQDSWRAGPHTRSQLVLSLPLLRCRFEDEAAPPTAAGYPSFAAVPAGSPRIEMSGRDPWRGTSTV